MSFETFNNNNDDSKPGNNNSPYGAPAAPQGNQNPNPYGYPSAPQANSPYAAPAQDSNPQQNAPYAQNQGQQAPAGGFNFLGLTWHKNVVPNPEAPGSQKSNVLAYVLWFFLGYFGVHQFYLGNTARGLLNLILGVGTSLLTGLTGGIPFGLVWMAYWIYEAVTLNDQTNEINSGYIRKSIL
jgi:TM2 domain-containing membrane protein YozV